MVENGGKMVKVWVEAKEGDVKLVRPERDRVPEVEYLGFEGEEDVFDREPAVDDGVF